MRKVLLGMLASALFSASALAGFGSGGHEAEQNAKDAAAKSAGKEARQEAVSNGATPAEARRAAAEAKQQARDAVDTNDSPTGVWIENN